MSKDNNDWISLTNKNHTKEFDHNVIILYNIIIGCTKFRKKDGCRGWFAWRLF